MNDDFHCRNLDTLQILFVTFHLQVRFGPLARVRLDRVVTVVDATWITWHRGAFFLSDLKLNLVEPLQIPQRFFRQRPLLSFDV